MKRRTLIYINVNFENHQLIYSGIEFAEFITYLTKPIENIMTITGGSDVILTESKDERGLELFEGYDIIQKLTRENVHSLGNFCFVDYIAPHKTNELREEQIAELLYLGHMFKPLYSPFFNELQNRFAYLSHDDGFFCKLYYRNLEDFLDVINGKIVSLTKSLTKKDINDIDIYTLKNLLQIAETGLLLDFGEAGANNNEFFVNAYSIGKRTNIDEIINGRKKLKENALNQKCLKYKLEKWSLS